LRLFSFGGYGLALAALALVVFGAIECPPHFLLCFLAFYHVLTNLVKRYFALELWKENTVFVVLCACLEYDE